jgi:transposase-like protein
MSYSDRVNAAKQKSLEEEVALVGAIYLGDNDTVKEAENYFKTRYPKFVGMNRTNEGLIVRIEGKEPVPYNFKDFKNAEEFTKSISALIMNADRATVGGITSRSKNYLINTPSQLKEDVGYGSVLSDAEARNQFGNVIEERANKVDKYQIGGVAVDKPKISFLEADYNTDDDDVRNLLIQNIKEAYPELELDVNIEQLTTSADQLTVSSDLINEPLKISIEQSGQENANASMTQFLNWIKAAYEGGNLIRKVAGSSSQPAVEVEAEVEEAEVEEAEVEEAEESTGAMSTFVKKKDESVNKGKSLKEAGKQQPTTPTVNASTDPGKSNYEHLIAMEEGFGGAPNAQGQATSLAGVYDVDQAEEYENSTTQVINYSKSTPNNKVMAFYGEKSNKNKNPKRGLRTDVTPQVYDDLSDNTKLILQTEHFNMHWDPRVLLLQTAGMLGNNTRGELHNDGDLLLTQWNSVINDPEKLAKFKEALEGNEEELLNNLEKIMKGTSGNQDQYTKRIAYLRNLL